MTNLIFTPKPLFRLLFIQRINFADAERIRTKRCESMKLRENQRQSNYTMNCTKRINRGKRIELDEQLNAEEISSE